MKNPNKYFAFKFTLTIILVISLFVTLIQESNANIIYNTYILQSNNIEIDIDNYSVSHEDNYLLFDTILQNKYETLTISNIVYNTIYDTVEL